MEIPTKRNFSTFEIECLLSLVEKYKGIIESKQTNAATNCEKRQAWISIADEFNTFGGVTKRTNIQLLNLYKNLKRKANKNKANGKTEVFTTGVAVKKEINDSENYSQEQLLSAAGITTPLHNEYDSDHVYNQITEITPDNISYEQREESSHNEETHSTVNFSTDTENQGLEVTDFLEIPKVSEAELKNDARVHFNRKRKRAAPASATAAAALVRQSEVKTAAILEEQELRRKEHVFKEEEHKLKMKILEKKLDILNQISENLRRNPDQSTVPCINDINV